MKLTIEVDEELYEKLFSDSFAVRILSVEECAVEMIRNGYEFHKLLSENRTPRYSHRNGETEPPTEAGFYWFIGRKRKHAQTTSKGGVYRVWWNSGELYTRIEPWSSCRVDELTGRWYGPVEPPWIARPTE